MYLLGLHQTIDGELRLRQRVLAVGLIGFIDAGCAHQVLTQRIAAGLVGRTGYTAAL
ncbi:hypothetical protein RNAN_1256 [Rheinheimera nanhaiensis E407-8]|uniref:Uncharacterized protein n=1 Tax=Rheinheimera nanhaiensis E407-8 TaxID=562729 RepID=I1DW57_9GAMM|nr:hypothetical protein RNAN_1256 [Rheinheimera nanhaiensis E407-8]